MTTSPNKMSDEEIRKQLVKSLSTAQVESVDDTGEAVIEYEADRLLRLIKQHREAYALEENKNGFFAACGVCGVENLENVEKYYQMYRAQLRENVGRDHSKR